MGAGEFERTAIQEGAEGLEYARALKDSYPFIKLIPYLLALLLFYGCTKLIT